MNRDHNGQDGQDEVRQPRRGCLRRGCGCCWGCGLIIALLAVAMGVWFVRSTAPFPADASSVAASLGHDVPQPQDARFDSLLTRAARFSDTVWELIDSRDGAVGEDLRAVGVYHVPDSPENVRSRYDKDLSTRGWIHMTEKDTPGHEVITYSKGDQRLTLQAQPDGRATLLILMRRDTGPPK